MTDPDPKNPAENKDGPQRQDDAARDAEREVREDTKEDGEGAARGPRRS